ncbi:hypothetical protein RchiOBHm_Chr1g0347271 [Rosa chinensis]|uniref:Uncharacterized protein n=1 Tax=Rosa chinensis TaxID=74649 RepID=A0A2P6SF84_ROSCH|nr:hypothetical protein RchiOBHm_Chr1g0347271 [Rosa chinensis]
MSDWFSVVSVSVKVQGVRYKRAQDKSIYVCFGEAFSDQGFCELPSNGYVNDVYNCARYQGLGE